MAKLSKERMSAIGRSNSRQGKSLERRVAKLFTEWTGHEFRRRRVEGRESNVIDRESTADVIPASISINLSIEVKKGAGFSLDAILAQPTKTKFCSWWHQSSYDAKLMTDHFKIKIYPFLFFKPSPNWDWVAFPISYWDLLVPKNDNINFPHLRYSAFESIPPVEHSISASKKNPKTYALSLEPCIFCRWKDFSENVDPISVMNHK